jgi:hypothetical protein
MGVGTSPAAKALQQACLRMSFYPVVLTFCWVFIWVSFFSASDSNQANPSNFYTLLFSTLSSPLLGMGIFMVFMINQPRARTVFLQLLTILFVPYYFTSDEGVVSSKDASSAVEMHSNSCSEVNTRVSTNLYFEGNKVSSDRQDSTVIGEEVINTLSTSEILPPTPTNYNIDNLESNNPRVLSIDSNFSAMNEQFLFEIIQESFIFDIK